MQIFPGRDGEPVKEGFTIPASASLSDVDLDEILSELDARTRDYVTLLANGAGEGLENRGNDLARIFKRFGPTIRDLSRVNHAVGRERIALRRLVTSLAQLNRQLARQAGRSDAPRAHRAVDARRDRLRGCRAARRHGRARTRRCSRRPRR